MDKNAIKKYAVWARTELITRVSQRAEKYDITAEADANASSVNGVLLSDAEKKQRKALIEQVKQKGFDQVMEEVAYTWFNRFIALRFMEVNGYLPSHIRVFTDDNNSFKPQILTEAIHLELDGLDMEKVYEMKSNNENDELYKYLIITQCNDLSKILPGMFQKIADYTELLFPDNVLREGSVIEQMVAQIVEADWDISEGGQIEILGWLYQFYISEKHEAVVDPLHGKVVNKDEVPAATALFTTDWVVRYIIDNSVGRYWIERNPESNLINELEYFVTPKDGIITTVDEKITPEELTVLDPSMGSAHFGVYAFDVLMKIYMEYGVSERDAAASIVEKNLFGLDIDDRSAQIAYFAIMMKARQYDRRFFTRGIQPHFYSIQESNNVDRNTIEYFSNGNAELRKDIDSILHDFEDAKEYGSIIQVKPVNFVALLNRLSEIEEDINMSKDIALSQLKPIIQVAKVMSDKYAVVATNPPYMNKYDAKLKEFILKKYKDYSGDLYSVFMYRNFSYCREKGYSGFMTPFVWMFIQTYEELRDYLMKNKSYTTLIQMEYSAFEEATVPICAFVLGNKKPDGPGYYFRLTEFPGGMEIQRQKVIEAQLDKDCGYYFETNQERFNRITGKPVAYWASDITLNAYNNHNVEKYMDCKSGIMTGSDKYIRMWYELSTENSKFDCRSSLDMGDYKWFPLNSGGDFRKWYGNNLKMVDLWHDGADIRANVKNYRLRDPNYYFKRGITWGRITSSQICFREIVDGSLFGDAGPIGFIEKYRHYVLGFLNSKVVKNLLQITNPTLNFQLHDITNLPLALDEKSQEKIEQLVKENISISKEDWDSSELSWQFSVHPFIRIKERHESQKLSDVYEIWSEECRERFTALKKNEETLNEAFIHIYGLEKEIDSTVNDKDVTVKLANYENDIRGFISYIIGCIMGRFSMEKEGICFAGGNFDLSKYENDYVDKDGIIPICDDEYFGDDITNLFIRYIKRIFGDEFLEENLDFIAKALGSGQSRQVIRDYFINNFYADHCKLYQKRPIYWLFDSGKKNGFKCLIYMHRYQQDTIARIRTDYVHEQQSRYRTAIEETENRLLTAVGSDKVKLNKKLKQLKEQDAEIHAYEEKIHHLADQMIPIDLDDGVKVNYAKFQDVLAKIK